MKETIDEYFKYIVEQAKYDNQIYDALIQLYSKAYLDGVKETLKSNIENDQETLNFLLGKAKE
jgi:hypothetical protein